MKISRFGATRLDFRATFVALLLLGVSVGLGARPSPPTPAPRASCASSPVHLDGDIGRTSVDRLIAAIHDRFRTFGPDDCHGSLNLFLSSRGGDAREAMRLGRFVRSSGVGTVVPLFPASCDGACVLVHAGGVDRTSFGRLGIRRPDPEPADPVDVDALEHRQDDLNGRIRTYLVEMDVSTELLDLMLAVPPGEIRQLTGDDEARLGLSGRDASHEEAVIARRARTFGLDSATYRLRRSRALERCRSVDGEIHGDISVDYAVTDWATCHVAVMLGMATPQAAKVGNRIVHACGKKSGRDWEACTFRQLKRLQGPAVDDRQHRP